MIILRRPPPSSLKRVVFWSFILTTFGLTQADMKAAIENLRVAGQLTTVQAGLLQIKIDDAEEYDRTDPDLLQIGQLMGLVSNQEDIDNLFRTAGSTNGT